MCNCCLVQELRSEVENLASRVLYMQEAKEDVRSDISVMKRAAEKAHGEVTQAEQLKKKQVCVWHYGKFPLWINFHPSNDENLSTQLERPY